MKGSIRRRISLLFIGLLLFMILCVVFAQSRYLEKYYIANKEKKLLEIYKVIDEDLKGEEPEILELREDLLKLTESGNIDFLVINQAEEAVITTNQESGKRLLSQLFDYLISYDSMNGQVLKKTALYEVRQSKDESMGLEYIEMWGRFSNDYLSIMRTPLASIEESVVISNKFLLYIGLGVLVTSMIFLWFFSRHITKPILELVTLSQKMAKLDFEEKYVSGGSDEIGILGSNFNTMAAELEMSISQLKEANHLLKTDIEKKEEIEKMRSEFIGNVSHELKTPIALIQGYAEGLKEGIEKDAKSREFYCEVIMDEAHKMNEMVKSLLTLNQLENQEIECVEVFDITELLCGVIQSVEILGKQFDVTIHFTNPDPIWVRSDEWKIEQVVRNYINNAIHHATGNRVVEIEAVVTDGILCVSVFNTGNPIPEDDIEHIWEKFYKVDKARTREYGGHGIGLSIVKAIMESLGHKYGVKNCVNGVMFWFEMEVVEQLEREEEHDSSY